jgi:hypothetical protein
MEHHNNKEKSNKMLDKTESKNSKGSENGS